MPGRAKIQTDSYKRECAWRFVHALSWANLCLMTVVSVWLRAVCLDGRSAGWPLKTVTSGLVYYGVLVQNICWAIFESFIYVQPLQRRTNRDLRVSPAANLWLSGVRISE